MIKIYGFDEKVFRCVPCLNAKRLCSAKKLDFEFYSVADFVGDDGIPVKKDFVDDLVKQTGQRSMPIIFNNDEFIGGFEDLRKAVAEGKIK